MDANWLLNSLAPDTADQNAPPTDERLKELAAWGGEQRNSDMAGTSEGVNQAAPESWVNALAHVLKVYSGNQVQSQAQSMRAQNAQIGKGLYLGAASNLNPAGPSDGAQASFHGNDPTLAAFDKLGATPLDKSFIKVESGGNPNARNAGHRGLFQFSPQEEAKYGINDSNWNDPLAALKAEHLKQADDAKQFASIVGRVPNPNELYDIHQRGIGGAVNEITHPNVPEYQNMLNTTEGRQRGEGWALQTVIQNVAGTPLANKDPRAITSAEMMALNHRRVGWNGNDSDTAAPQQVATKPVAPPGLVQQASMTVPAAGGVPLTPNDATAMQQTAQAPSTQPVAQPQVRAGGGNPLQGTQATLPNGAKVLTPAQIQYDPAALAAYAKSGGSTPADMAGIVQQLQAQTVPTQTDTGLQIAQTAPGGQVGIIPKTQAGSNIGGIQTYTSQTPEGAVKGIAPDYSTDMNGQLSTGPRSLRDVSEFAGHVKAAGDVAATNTTVMGTAAVKQAEPVIAEDVKSMKAAQDAAPDINNIELIQKLAGYQHAPHDAATLREFMGIGKQLESVFGFLGIPMPEITTDTITTGEAFNKMTAELNSKLKQDMQKNLGGAFDSEKFGALNLTDSPQTAAVMTSYVKQKFKQDLALGRAASDIQQMPDGPEKAMAWQSWPTVRQNIIQQNRIDPLFNGKPLSEYVAGPKETTKPVEAPKAVVTPKLLHTSKGGVKVYEAQ